VVDAAGVGEEEAEMAESFPEVVNSAKTLPAVKHGVEHVIETLFPRPIASRYR